MIIAARAVDTPLTSAGNGRPGGLVARDLASRLADEEIRAARRRDRGGR